MWTVWPTVTFAESTVTSSGPSVTTLVGVAPVGGVCKGYVPVPDDAPAPEGAPPTVEVCVGYVVVPDKVDPVGEGG